MKIKVCGMKYLLNIKELVALPIDMMGLIFYEKTKRTAENLPASELRIVPSNIQKVGVFVNASEETILDKIKEYDLQAVQLHGDESPDFCRKIRNTGIRVIKAFSIGEISDFKTSDLYENACDYFLFDTKTSLYGGSGNKFDWEILSLYTGETPFILSGGIGPEDAESIKKLQNPKLYGIDLNSRFEISPGEKDIEKIHQFLLDMK
jgi:phosphoribosylanthranilate isomerase